jgi:hypothetical protein
MPIILLQGLNDSLATGLRPSHLGMDGSSVQYPRIWSIFNYQILERPFCWELIHVGWPVLHPLFEDYRFHISLLKAKALCIASSSEMVAFLWTPLSAPFGQAPRYNVSHSESSCAFLPLSFWLSYANPVWWSPGPFIIVPKVTILMTKSSLSFPSSWR